MGYLQNQFKTELGLIRTTRLSVSVEVQLLFISSYSICINQLIKTANIQHFDETRQVLDSKTTE